MCVFYGKFADQSIVTKKYTLAEKSVRLILVIDHQLLFYKLQLLYLKDQPVIYLKTKGNSRGNSNVNKSSSSPNYPQHMCLKSTSIPNSRGICLDYCNPSGEKCHSSKQFVGGLLFPNKKIDINCLCTLPW